MALERVRDMLRICKEENDSHRRNTMLDAIEMEFQKIMDNQSSSSKCIKETPQLTQRHKIDKMSAEVKDSNPYRFYI